MQELSPFVSPFRLTLKTAILPKEAVSTKKNSISSVIKKKIRNFPKREKKEN